MSIKFGPSGLGSVKEAVTNLRKYSEMGFGACEIAFTYGVYIKRKEDALEIGKAAKELGIELSIHAPYWINLNSDDKKKIEKSKERILKCCEVGTWLGANVVVFHAGYYGKNKAKAYENIKKAILEIKKEMRTKNYTPKLAPEIMGKVNVFGSIEEIKKLSEETGCELCVDFAHILARYKNYKFKEMLKELKDKKNIHIHFSGIEYGELGEKHHKETKKEEWEKLISELFIFEKSKKNIVIINESPFPVEDSVLGLKVYLNHKDYRK